MPNKIPQKYRTILHKNAEWYRMKMRVKWNIGDDYRMMN